MNTEDVKRGFNNGTWEEQAKQNIHDPKKMEEMKSHKERLFANPALTKIRASLCLLWRYMEAVTSRRYTNYSLWALTKIVAVLIYVISPLDLVPDILPWVGFLDDIIAVGYVVNLTSEELNKFQAWEQKQMEQTLNK